MIFQKDFWRFLQGLPTNLLPIFLKKIFKKVLKNPKKRFFSDDFQKKEGFQKTIFVFFAKSFGNSPKRFWRFSQKVLAILPKVLNDSPEKVLAIFLKRLDDSSQKFLVIFLKRLDDSSQKVG